MSYQDFTILKSFAFGITLTGALLSIYTVLYNFQVPGLYSTGSLANAGLIISVLGLQLAVYVQSQEAEAQSVKPQSGSEEESN